MFEREFPLVKRQQKYLHRWLSGKKIQLPVKEALGLFSGSGRCPGAGNGNPLQYSCLENSIDRGAR